MFCCGTLRRHGPLTTARVEHRQEDVIRPETVTQSEADVAIARLVAKVLARQLSSELFPVPA